MSDKIRKYRATKKCHWNGRFWYGPERPQAPIYMRYPGMLKPPKYFVEIGDAEPELVKEPESMLEEQLKAMTKKQIAKKIFVEYGVKLDVTQEKGQLLIQATQVIADPAIPRKAAGEIGKPAEAKPIEGLPAKPICDLTPDEIESTTVKNMVKMLERDRGVVRSPSGMSKSKLFDLDEKLKMEQASQED